MPGCQGCQGASTKNTFGQADYPKPGKCDITNFEKKRGLPRRPCSAGLSPSLSAPSTRGRRLRQRSLASNRSGPRPRRKSKSLSKCGNFERLHTILLISLLPPARTLMVVVFPAPFWPSRQKISFCCICSESSLTAWVPA